VARARKSSSGFGTFVFGFLVALVVVAAALFGYLRYQAPPRTVANLPAPIRQIVGPPAPSSPSAQSGVYQPEATQPGTASAPSAPPAAHSEHALKQPPFGISEDVFETGAHLYRKDCAHCHGTPSHDAPFAAQMHLPAAQLWRPHGHGPAIGVSAQAPGEIYAHIENGILPAGMPAYAHILSERQIWELSLLLKNADQPLPDPVQQILAAGKP
jgi:thiosulfate dehydrogenase